MIFAALALGHFGLQIPDGVGILGLVMFVYCVGLSAGPGFFRVFVQHGKTLVPLGSTLIVIGTLTAWIAAMAFGVPADSAARIFAGHRAKAVIKDLKENEKVQLTSHFAFSQSFGV